MERQDDNIDSATDKEAEDEHVTYEDPSADHTHFDENSCEQFVRYCQTGSNLKKYEERLREAEEDVADIEDDLRSYGQQIQQLQSRLKDAKLHLNKVKNSNPVDPKNSEVLRTEWEAIKNMRGVTNIYYNEEEKALCVDVAVRVSYEGEIYDFGDYTIKIWYNGIECPRVRSGIREDWEGGYPNYCYENGGDFCLGDRENSIDEFISEQRLREAIILVIDCMHSVNDENEAADIPNCFRRIVPPKEG